MERLRRPRPSPTSRRVGGLSGAHGVQARAHREGTLRGSQGRFALISAETTLHVSAPDGKPFAIAEGVVSVHVCPAQSPSVAHITVTSRTVLGERARHGRGGRALGHQAVDRQRGGSDRRWRVRITRGCARSGPRRERRTPHGPPGGRAPWRPWWRPPEPQHCGSTVARAVGADVDDTPCARDSGCRASHDRELDDGIRRS